jgi:hypothetical protein
VLVSAAVIGATGASFITPAGKPGFQLAASRAGPEASTESGAGRAISVGEALDTIDWDYPDKRVRLAFFRCAVESGEPQSLEGQELAWVSPFDLRRYEFPPADARLIERLCGR